ncbi:glycoside hydrolase superfamily [Xylariales sp. PMI_506]|nr:glycoside hydrolase superfamily [Xylariales sp. PMI_506]
MAAVGSNFNSSAESIPPKPLEATAGGNDLAQQLEGSAKTKSRRKAILVAAVIVGSLVATHVIKTGSRNIAVSGDSSNSGSSSSDSSSGGSGDSGSSSSGGSSSGSSSSDGDSGTTIDQACSTSDDIPTSLKGTWVDPTSWSDLTDFNCTFTNVTVGGLPIVGLNSTWDDSAKANPTVPALSDSWGTYGSSNPIRGVNIGGWLSLEPFITPSLFAYSSDLGIVDEYTLCTHLGPDEAIATLDKHYSTFITEADFQSIAAAGLDHVRIPFSYWAVRTYEGDSYVEGVSWRYLLRGIEWARKYGLRVNLDLHALPGSQNGWNHSGRQGKVDWLVGADGALNAQRSLDIHNQLSTFFGQDRYKNVVAFYGLANEPGQSIPVDALANWTATAYEIVRGNGVEAPQIFSESMKGLSAWAGELTGYGDSLVIDVHEYTVFDPYLIGLKHGAKMSFACDTYGTTLTASMAGGSKGFGPTMVGEWSQADTDCERYLNGVGNGARWNGTFSGVTSPSCPTKDSQCSCDLANADPSTFSDAYIAFLQDWAAAQMSVFEESWGWFYWTWKTESAPLWSYQAGLEGKFMPPLAYQRSWDCSKTVPDFGSLPEYF